VKLELLIIDANVLIDFCKTDRTVLALVAKHVATVHVAEPVLAEVAQLDRPGAEALGLHVVQPEYTLMKTAASAGVRSPLRFQDWVCLLLAKQRTWTCVTNDKRLRTECEAHAVTVLWGLQLLLRLVERRALPAAAAIDLARAIHAVNRRLPKEVIAAFTRQVKALR
jgi:hypothetical protein